MPDVIPGVDVTVVDQPDVGPGASTATETGFLLTTDSTVPATGFLIIDSSDDYPVGATNLINEVDAYRQEGSTPTAAPIVYVTRIGSETGVGLLGAPALAARRFPRSLGPGQLMAPSVVASLDKIALDQIAFEDNRIYLGNGPAAAADSALLTLAQASIDAALARNSSLWPDTAILPGIGREVPWAITEGGIIARNDLTTGNPGLAAAGDQGIAKYAIGIKAERSDAAMTQLNAGQVNVARAPYGGAPRGYGYRTLGKLSTIPQWWDLGGSRVVMDVRAYSQSKTERVLFRTLSADRIALIDWKSGLDSRLLQLWKLGALFGDTPQDAFSVDTGPLINPDKLLATGRARAVIKLKTSPFLEKGSVAITREKIA